MKIAVVGIGYVGLVTGTGLAELGHQVTCISRNKKINDNFRKGIIPLYEPGLKELVLKNLKRKHLFFTTDFNKGVKRAKIIFITVQTPPEKEGGVDLSFVLKVARQIGQTIKSYKVIVNKSTVPVGTAKKVTAVIKKYYKGDFDVVSCPEFLREGNAVYDFFRPDRIVIGYDRRKAGEIMKKVFAKIKANILGTKVENAELIKYASNAFLATKISFINEIANVCEKVGANVEVVAKGMGLDKRIGRHFLKAGIGYGGSCFPKDVRGLNQIAGTHGYNFKLLKAVIEVNNFQRMILVDKLKKILGNVKGRRIAVFGLAFKNNTDDVRESAAIEIIRKLRRQGAKISAFDPVARNKAARVLNDVDFFDNPYQTVKAADALIIATEWPQFEKFDWVRIRKLLKTPLVLDGRNILPAEKMKKIGFKYLGIGR